MRNSLLIILLAIACLGFKCGKQTTPGISDDEIFKGVLSNDHTRVTAAGATIASAKSIPAHFTAFVDAGFADVFAIAQAPPNNYNLGGLGAANYRVWMFPRSRHCENAAFLVDATHSPYEGSEWDKDPSPNRCLLCAAGMTVMQGDPIVGAGMVITDDIGVMRTIVRYEAEHSILWYVDRQRYNDTMYHDANSGHPILGDGPPSIRPAPDSIAAVASTWKHVHIKIPADINASRDIVAASGQDACVLLTK